MRNHALATALAWLVLSPAPLLAEPPRRVRPDADRAGAAAVVAPIDAALVHTTQIGPVDGQGTVVAEDRQIAAAFDRLETVLTASGSDLTRLVRLHVVLDRDDWREPIRRELAKRLGGAQGPAWTFVGGPVPIAGARFALDAVAALGDRPSPKDVERTVVPSFPEGIATFAVLPGGPRVYISGQASPDADLAASTRKTLQSLLDSLKTLGLGAEHVVQLKAFIQPTTSADVVLRETIALFPGSTAPPLVIVGWDSSATQPIEIELVAAAPGALAEDVVDFPPLPPLPASPVFSRSARILKGSVIYTAGLVGSEGSSGPDQVQSIFDELRTLLEAEKSDFRHMAKATYYVSDKTANTAINAIRPSLYDPARPPAASKAVVSGVGFSGRGVAIDMIAVAP